MIRTEHRAVLPLLALLVFLNGALCFCLDLGHGHDHGHEQESDQPAPHDCECALSMDFVLPDSPATAGPAGPLVAAVTAAEVVALADQRDRRGPTQVRPPGADGPPRYVLHRSLLC